MYYHDKHWQNNSQSGISILETAIVITILLSIILTFTNIIYVLNIKKDVASLIDQVINQEDLIPDQLTFNVNISNSSILAVRNKELDTVSLEIVQNIEEALQNRLKFKPSNYGVLVRYRDANSSTDRSFNKGALSNALSPIVTKNLTQYFKINPVSPIMMAVAIYIDLGSFGLAKIIPDLTEVVESGVTPIRMEVKL